MSKIFNRLFIAFVIGFFGFIIFGMISIYNTKPKYWKHVVDIEYQNGEKTIDTIFVYNYVNFKPKLRYGDLMSHDVDSSSVISGVRSFKLIKTLLYDKN